MRQRGDQRSVARFVFPISERNLHSLYAQTGIKTDGGYAEYCTLDATALAHIPEDMDVAKAAPLLCAGVTVFNGMRNMGSESLSVPITRGSRRQANGFCEQSSLEALLLSAVGRSDRGMCITLSHPHLGHAGIGGLGHLAIQFAAKSGYNVVALSQSESKKDLAMKLGAHHYLSGNDVVCGSLAMRIPSLTQLISLRITDRPTSEEIRRRAVDHLHCTQTRGYLIVGPRKCKPDKLFDPYLPTRS